MDAKARRAFRDLTCDVTFDQSLVRYGTYRIGGPAAAVVRPNSVEDVVAAVVMARDLELPWLALGLGSNVLFDDEGYRGLIIRIAATMTEVRQNESDENIWTVGAGLPIPRLAKQTARVGLAGVHRMIGVPGAVGGGVFMNAGAHGQDFATVVRLVSLVTDDGELLQRERNTIPWQYRASGLAGVVVSTEIELEPTDPVRVKRELVECITRRRAGTPFDHPCCGSVFRNPPPNATSHLPGDRHWTAGRLIEAAGMKRYRVGGAEVSPMHANYIVNVGGATATDVKTVIDDVRRTVCERFGVHLIREVKFVSPDGILESQACE